MNIIVIGMDNSGKTTLCEQLKERMPQYKVVKSTGKASKEVQHTYVLQSILDTMYSQDIIYDRFPIIDEMIYGYKLRGKSNFEPAHIFMLKDLIKPVIIYCRPKKKDITNFGDREQMEGVIENAMMLIEEYDDHVTELARSGLRVYTYNYRLQNVDDVIKYAKEAE